MYFFLFHMLFLMLLTFGQCIDLFFTCFKRLYCEYRERYSISAFTAINQGLDFDDMSSFLPSKIDDAIQYINLGYGTQTPKIVIF